MTRGKTILIWVLAFLITAGSAVFQRITGPTYPLRGKAELGGKEISYNLARSHEGETDHVVSVVTGDPEIRGTLEWKRYKSDDTMRVVPMEFRNDTLFASMPGQPSAGKLEYVVILQKGEQEVFLPQEKAVVIRFKGEVPSAILISHVIFIFVGMLLSTRTVFEALFNRNRVKQHALWTLGIIFIGGLIFGPIVQKYAFGEFWTGIPFGYDLTDNKTLIAFLVWVFGVYAIYKIKNSKPWVIVSGVVMLIVFMIPHSVLGSELNYKELDKIKKQQEQLK